MVFHEHAPRFAPTAERASGQLRRLATQARSFASLVLVQTPPLNVMGPHGAEQVVPPRHDRPSCSTVFGVRPLLGRGFTADETRPGQRGRWSILGHGFWQRWFGGDPGVLGRQLAVPDGSLTIVGVAPPGFRIGLHRARRVHAADDRSREPGGDRLARLSMPTAGSPPEVTVDGAQAEMSVDRRGASTAVPLRRAHGRVRVRPARVPGARGASRTAAADGGRGHRCWPSPA